MLEILALFCFSHHVETRMADLQITAVAIHILTNRLEQAGGDVAAALRHAGLDGTPIESYLQPLPLQSFIDLDAFCREWSGDPLFSSNAILRSVGDEFEWTRFALFSLPTLRESIRLGSESWQKVATPIDLISREGEAGLESVLQFRQPPGPNGDIVMEYHMAQICTPLLTAPEVPVLPDRISFTHAPRASKTAYRDTFGVEVEFNAQTNSNYLSNAKLDLPLKHPDNKLAKIAYQTFMKEAGRFQLDAGNTAMVALQILRHEKLPEKWHLQGMAGRLGIPPRTLQYHLKKAGTSFHALLDMARQELAQQYRERGLSQASIAEKLGFADEGSLRKAFQRWYGMPPGKRTSPRKS